MEECYNQLMDASPTLNPQAHYVLGIDIGGTKLATVLATREGQIVYKLRLPTEAQRGPAFGVERIKAMLRQTLAETGVSPPGGTPHGGTPHGAPPPDIMGIGVACGGPLDAEQGVILGPPNLSTWNPVPIKAILEAEFGLDVELENDANAGALAEWLFGAGRGKRHIVYMTMGTGIGGGLILDGRLYRGANGNAGEVGHTRVVEHGGPLCGCGKRGCLEALCSGPAIARRVRQAVQAAPSESHALLAQVGSPDELTAEHLFVAARQGDPLALRLVDETAYYLGIALANIIQTLNPEVIVLGTIAVQQGDFFLDRVRQVVRNEIWPQMAGVVEILPSPLGDQVGDYAAISIILQHLVC